MYLSECFFFVIFVLMSVAHNMRGMYQMGIYFFVILYILLFFLCYTTWTCRWLQKNTSNDIRNRVQISVASFLVLKSNYELKFKSDVKISIENIVKELWTFTHWIKNVFWEFLLHLFQFLLETVWTKAISFT